MTTHQLFYTDTRNTDLLTSHKNSLFIQKPNGNIKIAILSNEMTDVRAGTMVNPIEPDDKLILSTANKCNLTNPVTFNHLNNDTFILEGSNKEKFIFTSKDKVDKYAHEHRTEERVKYKVNNYLPNATIFYDDRYQSVANFILENHLEKDVERFPYTKTKKNYEEFVAYIEEQLEKQDLTSISKQWNDVSLLNTFLNFSKKLLDDKTEVLPDKKLNEIVSSKSYKSILQSLHDKGFNFSKTQQFNVLQQVGIKQTKNRKPIYNLSDMGSGKTLMTVEATYLTDSLLLEDFLKKEQEFKNYKGILLPDKHIIAPKLSIKSSWLTTFQNFYGLTKISDNHYELTLTLDHLTATAQLYFADFTVTTKGTRIHHHLPYVKDGDDVIIDEIHQFTTKPIATTKFAPLNHPRCFNQTNVTILSGTLSQLKPSQWGIILDFLGQNVPTSTTTPPDLGDMQRKENVEIDFIPLSRDQKEKLEEKLPSTLSQINNNYNTKIYHTDQMTFSAPKFADDINYELFYRVIQGHAITASSKTIAKELFGELPTHESIIINTDSYLEPNHIKILKTLNKVANDKHIYKNNHLATAIRNSFLNLNDGLNKETIIDIFTKAKKSSTRFKDYMDNLDSTVMQDILRTHFIQDVDITETEKFKIVQKLVEKHCDENIVIVTNDLPSATILAKKLNGQTLTKQEFSDSFNYQETIERKFTENHILVLPQSCLKSSLDLIMCSVLIQYQLNTEISDIIQTQNRINRIGQKSNTVAYYIACDQLQNNIIQDFLETYKQISIAHEGILELFREMTDNIAVYDTIDQAIDKLI